MQCKLSEFNGLRPARVVALTVSGPMRRRLQDLGFVPTANVQLLFEGLRGGIRAYAIDGSVIALRRGDADHIMIEV